MPEKMDNERGGLNDRLKDFQVNPDEKIWASLEEKLAQKRKRRPVAIWWFAGAAVFLVLLIGTPMLIDQFNQQPNQESVDINTAIDPKISELNTKKQDQIVDIQNTKEDFETINEEQQEIEKSSELISKKTIDDSKTEKSAEKSNSNPNRQTQIRNARTQVLAGTLENYKNQKQEGRERKKVEKRKVSEFTSKLAAALPEISGKKHANSDRENQIQSAIGSVNADFSNQNATETHTDKQEENSIIESESDKGKTTVAQSQQEIVKESEVALLQPVDSIKKVKEKVEDVAESSRPVADSSRKDKTRKWQKSVWIAPKFALMRNIAINQNQGEKRIALAEENTEWNARLAFDLGFGIDRKMNSWLSLSGFCGLSYLQEQLMISKENILNVYDLVAENGTLSINPKKEKLRGKLQSQLLAGFCGIGLGLKPKESTTLRLSAGSQFQISETITKEMAGDKQSNQKSATLSEPIFFIQTSASRQILFGKNRLELEPMIQYFSSPVFNLQPGTSSRPLFIGMQVRLSW